MTAQGVGAGRVHRLLGPGGPLSLALPGYEARDGQLAMAVAVEAAFQGERVLLCEAGTGTGKTLAYLVPAMLSGKKVVISTATKALEEQIFHKDLPLIAKTLGIATNAALVKGLGNYLCLRRYEELRASPASLAEPSARRSLPLLEAWARSTTTGDVGELEALREGDPLWREVCSSSETRVGAECEHYERCFVTRMKREAADARLLVVNHHLFFADLAVKAQTSRRGAPGAGPLPLYDAIVFDEAHQLEDVATDFLGVRISRARIEAMLRDADRAFLAARVAAKSSGGARPGKGTGLCDSVRVAADELFALLARQGLARAADAGSRAGRPASDAPLTGDEALEALSVKATLPRDLWSGTLLAAYHRLDTELEALEHFADANAVDETIRLVTTRAAQLRDDFAKVVEPATHQVTWVEVRGRSVSVGASPIDVGGYLRKEVFERVSAAVLTSATLTTGADTTFRFLRSRVGLTAEDGLGIEELSIPSPFAFGERSMLYTPRDLPETSDPAFIARAADRVAELLQITGGGAFVLCTSMRAMRGLADALRVRWPTAPLVQGDAPKGALLRRFREDGHAVLVATMSFWEGVDVPGDALRLVVIEKIPFAVPSEPVVAARCAAIEAAGGNPFISYSVPQAAITLKQGFGRLLRSHRDHGVVAILDRRVKTRGYGRTLLDGLPPARRTELMDDVRAFWSARDVPTP